MGSVPANFTDYENHQAAIKLSTPHAVMFPYPAQGHINPMMQLAKRLLSEGFMITFVNTDFNHKRMFNNKKTAEELMAMAPRMRFEFVEDGLPENHGRFNQNVVEVTAAILSFPGKLAKLVRKINAERSCKVTCIIADAFCSWVQDVADQFGIPRVSLWTTPAHANLAYHFQEKLMDEGYIPLKGDAQKQLSQIITCIPGIAPMKLEDYISFFLIDNTVDFLFQWHLRLCMRRADEAAWNLGNNFEYLEFSAISAFKAEVPSFLPIGPLLLSDTSAARAPSLWSETNCEAWLSQQNPSSVLYISFGSLVNMPELELSDLIQGIETSGFPFLWAVRPDQISSSPALSHMSARVATNPSKGLIVDWAPQTTVLNHPSVGAFLSHCGWNSTVEALCCGVPILAKPGGFAEQRMNAHYIEHVWNVGVRLPAAAKPDSVKAHIQSLLGGSSNAVKFRQRLTEIKTAAREAVSPPSGSSYSNLKLFIEDMRSRAL